MFICRSLSNHLGSTALCHTMVSFLHDLIAQNLWWRFALEVVAEWSKVLTAVPWPLMV